MGCERWIVPGLLLAAACGGEQTSKRDVVALVDAFRERTAGRARSTFLPPAHRRPGLGMEPLDRPRGRDPAVEELARHRAAAVPVLVRLLRGPVRRAAAARLLGALRAEAAAPALWREFELLLDHVEAVTVFEVSDGGRTSDHEGVRHDGVDGDFYGAVRHALCCAGAPVADRITRAARAALRRTEARAARGEELIASRTVQRGGRTLDELIRARPLHEATELMELLAWTGAETAAPLFAEALRSPVDAIRRSALRHAWWLASDAPEILRALDALLDSEAVYDSRAGILEKERAGSVIFFLVQRRQYHVRYLDEAKRKMLPKIARERVREHLKQRAGPRGG